MLREAARREFIAIITLDGLSEAALRTRCLAPVCVWKHAAKHTQQFNVYGGGEDTQSETRWRGGRGKRRKVV